MTKPGKARFVKGRSGTEPFIPSEWDKVALKHARQAAIEIGSGVDAIPTLSAAIAALRVAAGELSADEYGEDFGEDADTTTAADAP